MTLISSIDIRHGNYVVYTILYTDKFKSYFIRYYLLCNNIVLLTSLILHKFKMSLTFSGTSSRKIQERFS